MSHFEGAARQRCKPFPIQETLEQAALGGKGERDAACLETYR